MCLILNFFLYSPLEQFEISAYNTSLLSYSTTFSLDMLDVSFYPTNKVRHYSMCKFTIFLIFSNMFIWWFYVDPQDENPTIKTPTLVNALLIFIFVVIIIANFNLYAFHDIKIANVVHKDIWRGPKFLEVILYKKPQYMYITNLTSFTNVYSVLFCFIFTYIIIYLIYNKMLSAHSNTLIPSLYQMIGENLYTISLNLFYSILGKHVTIPEFFIKINTIFVFLIISNVQGMIPYMSTLTSALTNTFFIALALFISIISTILDKKGITYFLNLFMPPGCPILLSLLIIPIEVISYSFRLVSLSVRLFANMMAGHTLLKVIVGFSWIIVFLGNTFIINMFPIIILAILTLLEFGVALIQAYIFTVLSCIYLRDIFEGH